MSKQESIGLRLKKTFLGEEKIEHFSGLSYLIDFYFPKQKLAVEIDELGHANKDSIKENKDKRNRKYKKYFGAYDGLGEIFKFFYEFKKKRNKNLEKRKKGMKKRKIFFKRKDFKKIARSKI